MMQKMCTPHISRTILKSDVQDNEDEDEDEDNRPLVVHLSYWLDIKLKHTIVISTTMGGMEDKNTTSSSRKGGFLVRCDTSIKYFAGHNVVHHMPASHTTNMPYALARLERYFLFPKLCNTVISSFWKFPRMY